MEATGYALKKGNEMGDKITVADILIEDRALDAVDNLVRLSRHVKYTSVAATSRLLVLGTSTGMLFVFQRHSLKQLFIIPTTASCSILLVRVSVNEKYIATSRSDGGASLVELYPWLKGQPVVTDALACQHGRKITDIVWNAAGNTLFAGDDEGHIYGCNASGSKLFNRAEELTRVDSSVVQLDHVGDMLLISTLTRCYILNTTSKENMQVGIQLRNGRYGACFMRLPDVGTPVIYCARQGGRLWEVDFKGCVLNTHKLRDSMSRIAAVSLFDCRAGLMEGKSTATTPAVVAFSLLTSFSSKYLLSRSDSHICIIDPISLNVLMWTDQLKEMVDVCCVNEDLYAIGAGGGEVHEIHFTSISDYMERHLLQKSSDSTSAAGCSNGKAGYAEIICRICLTKCNDINELLCQGVLSPDLLCLLHAKLKKEQTQSGSCSKNYLADMLMSAFSSWISHNVIEIPDGGKSENGHNELSDVLLQNKGIADVIRQKRVASELAATPPPHLSDVCPSHDDVSQLCQNGATATLLHSTSTSSGTEVLDAVPYNGVGEASSNDDYHVSSLIIRSGSRDSLDMNSSESISDGGGCGGSSRRSSLASYSSADLPCAQREAAQEAHGSSAADKTPPVPTKLASRIPSAKQIFSIVSSAKSPIDGVAARLSTFVDALKDKTRTFLDHEKDQAPQVSKAAFYLDERDVGGTALSRHEAMTASSAQLSHLLLQTRELQVGLRALHGHSGCTQALTTQLLEWTALLCDAKLAVDEGGDERLRPCTGLGQVPPQHVSGCTDSAQGSVCLLSTQPSPPVRVSSPWPLSVENRDMLSCMAMLSVETGCTTTYYDVHLLPQGHQSSASRDDMVNDAPAAECSLPSLGQSNDAPAAERSLSSLVHSTCCFMRQFFFLMNLQRLAFWIASVPLQGLSYWKCFVECLEEAERHGDGIVMRLQVGYSSAADEMQSTLMLAKSQPRLAGDAAVAARVYLCASRFVKSNPENVMAFCCEMRRHVRPAHVMYLLEVNEMESSHFVIYMDKMLQALSGGKLRRAFVREQCSIPALRYYWLKAMLSVDAGFSSELLHCCCCCGMIRPGANAWSWAHGQLLDEIVKVCAPSGDATASKQKDDDSVALLDLLLLNCYWKGCVIFWKLHRDIDALLKCLIQSGDMKWFEKETEALNLSDLEWEKVLQLRSQQEQLPRQPQQLGGDSGSVSAKVPSNTAGDENEAASSGSTAVDCHDVVVHIDCLPRTLLEGKEQSSPDSNHSSQGSSLELLTSSSASPFNGGLCFDSVQAVARPPIELGHDLSQLETITCLYCNETIGSAKVVDWEWLVLLIAKRKGLQKTWLLLKRSNLPQGVLRLPFYSSCLKLAAKERQQQKTVVKMVEVMNSYLWSKRPSYSAPSLRYVIEQHLHDNDTTSEVRHQRSSQFAMHEHLEAHQTATWQRDTQLQLDDAECHWGVSVNTGSGSRCLMCGLALTSCPSPASDSSILIFDCAHTYHRYCLLNERVCPTCNVTCASYM